MRVHGWFTLGGLLATAWRPSQPLLPWALTSALLTVAALWGHWTSGGPVDWVVLGLAAYELMMGLLGEEEEPNVSRVTSPVVGPSAVQASKRNPIG